MILFLKIFIVLLIFTLAFITVIYAFFRDEIVSTRERDPAAKNDIEIILLYSGLHAVVSHRVAHRLWLMKLKLIARLLSQISRFFTGIEIHPGARIGRGLFIDHGMGVVIGETAIVGDNCTLFQGVTLGGTGKESGKRHPTLGQNVVVGAGAKVLGNITIGDNSYVGANAVILKPVPANATVVGVPGHITKKDGHKIDPMDHVHISDPVMVHMKDLLKRIKCLEDQNKDK
ncbi:MAG: serine O-acetyltransferase [Candidatus Omnitrophica bacterium]|nr:serine O-acetyltransferase [Candidatus Omnitrophota bacterium]MCB9719357.1 serine O-acetyltransferase [Candidatus Omnitrophota bacterium]